VDEYGVDDEDSESNYLNRDLWDEEGFDGYEDWFEEWKKLSNGSWKYLKTAFFTKCDQKTKLIGSLVASGTSIKESFLLPLPWSAKRK
jgi:hypothetical protein